jgi:hypothetical protein
VADELELAQTTQRVLELLEFCASHLKHENDFIHTAIEARASGASEVIAHEHEEHLQHIAQLSAVVAALRACPQPALRQPVADRLYSELALFIADNFQHMHVEETAHNAVLWARYTDAELHEIHDAIVASIPPQELMYEVRWIVPFMNPAQRAEMLKGVRANAPAAAFQAILDTVQPHMSQVEWGKLMRALELPVVPGLVTA